LVLAAWHLRNNVAQNLLAVASPVMNRTLHTNDKWQS
jgi:hypothetical protein